MCTPIDTLHTLHTRLSHGANSVPHSNFNCKTPSNVPRGSTVLAKPSTGSQTNCSAIQYCDRSLIVHVSKAGVQVSDMPHKYIK